MCQTTLVISKIIDGCLLPQKPFNAQSIGLKVSSLTLCLGVSYFFQSPDKIITPFVLAGFSHFFKYIFCDRLYTLFGSVLIINLLKLIKVFQVSQNHVK